MSGSLTGGELVDVASTAVEGLVEAATTKAVPLVIPAGELTPGGTYQFECRAQYSGEPYSTPGYAALTVVVNSPPSSGVLAASPAQGAVMDTAFELSCSGWVDDATDLPLLYSFFYKIMGDATEFQIVSRTPSTRFAGVLLPAGGGNASEVIVAASRSLSRSMSMRRSLERVAITGRS
jgi:hypothetical protein